MTEKELDNRKEKELIIPQLETFGVSGGLVCDFETGICGPVEKVENLKQEEKNKK